MAGLHQIIKAAYEKKSRWRVQISKPGPGAMNHTFRLRREDNNVNVIKKKILTNFWTPNTRVYDLTRFKPHGCSGHYFRYALDVRVHINTRTQPRTLISTVVQPVSSLPRGHVLKLFLAGRRVCTSENARSCRTAGTIATRRTGPFTFSGIRKTERRWKSVKKRKTTTRTRVAIADPEIPRNILPLCM